MFMHMVDKIAILVINKYSYNNISRWLTQHTFMFAIASTRIGERGGGKRLSAQEMVLVHRVFWAREHAYCL